MIKVYIYEGLDHETITWLWPKIVSINIWMNIPKTKLCRCIYKKYTLSYYMLLTYLCRIITLKTNVWTIRDITNIIYPCKYDNNFKCISKLSISYDISANLTNACRICICLVSIHNLHPESKGMQNISNQTVYAKSLYIISGYITNILPYGMHTFKPTCLTLTTGKRTSIQILKIKVRQHNCPTI